jgi:hypothetical protein
LARVKLQRLDLAAEIYHIRDRVLDSNIDPPGRFDARLVTIFF